MKRALFFSVLIVFSGFIRCTENDETPARENKTSTTVNSKATSAKRSDSPFHESVGAPISFETAQRWIANFKKKNVQKTESHFFGTETFKRLLENPDCVGISIQYATDDKGQPQLLLVGIDEKGKMMTGENRSGKSEEGELVFEDESSPCPPICPQQNF